MTETREQLRRAVKDRRNFRKVSEFWDEFLETPGNADFVAPVTMFKYAPLKDIWEAYATPGMVIEIINPFIQHKKIKSKDINWIATINRFAGYSAQIEMERFDIPPKRLHWIPFCSQLPKYFGFSQANEITVHPEIDVADAYPNYRQKLLYSLQSRGPTRTIYKNHLKYFEAVIKKEQRYQIGLKVEVIDVNCPERNQIGTVDAVVGDRIHIRYEAPLKLPKYDYGCFLSIRSEHLYPIGWSQFIGHQLYAISDPNSAKAPKKIPPERLKIFQESVKNLGLVIPSLQIEEGMVLEIRSPEFPGILIPALVGKVLQFGYFMAEFQGRKKNETFWICYHVRSGYVLPCGFAEKYGICIQYPEVNGISPGDGRTYCNLSNRKSLDLIMIHKAPSKFKVGMKLEAIHLYNPHVIRPATVERVAGHLIMISYDGYKTSEDETLKTCPFAWFDSESPDIYPLGYAEMVVHKFEGRPENVPHELKAHGLNPQEVQSTSTEPAISTKTATIPTNLAISEVASAPTPDEILSVAIELQSISFGIDIGPPPQNLMQIEALIQESMPPDPLTSTEPLTNVMPSENESMNFDSAPTMKETSIQEPMGDPLPSASQSTEPLTFDLATLCTLTPTATNPLASEQEQTMAIDSAPQETLEIPPSMTKSILACTTNPTSSSSCSKGSGSIEVIDVYDSDDDIIVLEKEDVIMSQKSPSESAPVIQPKSVEAKNSSDSEMSTSPATNVEFDTEENNSLQQMDQELENYFPL